jgi:hypothetical protein
MSDKQEAKSSTPTLRLMPSIKAEKGATYGPSAYRDEPLSEMRRTIAKRLVTSLGPVPHFFLTSEIEMDRAAICGSRSIIFIRIQKSVLTTSSSRSPRLPDSESAGERFVPGQDGPLLRAR